MFPTTRMMKSQRCWLKSASWGGGRCRLDMDGFKDALVELIEAETIRRATLWQTTELQALGVLEILAGLGIEIVSSQAGKDALARCDLGVTGVDMALPETGTLACAPRPNSRARFRCCRVRASGAGATGEPPR